MKSREHKVIQNKDVIFFEDQIVNDIEKTENGTFSVDTLVKLVSNFPLVLDDSHQDSIQICIPVGDTNAEK